MICGCKSVENAEVNPEKKRMKSIICPKCGSHSLEEFSDDEYACPRCRTYFKLTRISDSEMIEWFIN